MKYTKVRASCITYVKCDNCGARFPADSPIGKFRLNGELKGAVKCNKCGNEQVVNLTVVKR